ncbi:MAG: hypothetical protein WC905_02835 [Patescibacteria group bacterium]|jgi:biotin operon repressor
MTAQDYFDCKKHNCRLTVEACMARRTAFKEHRNRLIPEYPECQECSQYYTVQKNKTQRGENIMSRSKIDQEKLKAMVQEGKRGKEIAKHFGVSEAAVWQNLKKHGLKLNSKRGGEERSLVHRSSPKDTTEQRAIPVMMPGTNPEGQIIPVTLRLNVEVNVRVSAERV